MTRTQRIVIAAVLAAILTGAVAFYASRPEFGDSADLPIVVPSEDGTVPGGVPTNNPNDGVLETGPITADGGGAAGTVEDTVAEVVLSGKYVAGGAECQLFEADNGERYTLVGDAVRNAASGDRARVTGKVAEVSFCMQGTTLAVEKVEKL